MKPVQCSRLGLLLLEISIKVADGTIAVDNTDNSWAGFNGATVAIDEDVIGIEKSGVIVEEDAVVIAEGVVFIHEGIATIGEAAIATEKCNMAVDRSEATVDESVGAVDKYASARVNWLVAVNNVVIAICNIIRVADARNGDLVITNVKRDTASPMNSHVLREAVLPKKGSFFAHRGFTSIAAICWTPE